MRAAGGAALALASLLLAGCFNVTVVAPPGQEVTLVADSTPVTVKRRYRTWFVVWGLTPLDNTMPDVVIGREHLREVRVTSEDNVPDAFLGVLYNLLIPIGLVTQTIVVEGNRAPGPDAGS